MRRSRRRFLLTAGMAASAAFPRPVSAQARGLVRMAGVFSDSFGEPFFVKDAGAFARHGFDVEASNMPNVGAVIAAMAGGSLEMGIGDVVLCVKAIYQGAPVRMVASSGMYLASAPTQILAVTPNSPIRAVKDLVGKTVAVPTLGGLTASTLVALLPKNGVDVSQVKVVEIPQSACVPALQRGTVDAALVGEPFISGNKGKIRDIAHPYDVIAKEFPLSVWYAAKGWLDADPSRAREAVAAIYETSRWANAHQSETLEILVRDAHFDPAMLRGMVRTTFATSLTPGLIQATLDFCTQYKIFDRHVEAGSVIAKL